MRRAALLCVVALSWAPTAAAAPPTVTARASATTGSVPFQVTLTAEGDAALYRWELGDGATAEGPVVSHTYTKPGLYQAAVTGLSNRGETTTATVGIGAFRLTLESPLVSTYRAPMRFRGRLVPAVDGAVVKILANGAQLARVRVRADGRFVVRPRVRAPGVYTARWGAIRAPGRTMRMRPLLDARLRGERTVGGRLTVAVHARPARAGVVIVRARRGGQVLRERARRGSITLTLPTGRPGDYRISVRLRPARGFTVARRALATTVVQPDLSLGAQGPSVRVLERRLAELRYALPQVDTVFGLETYQAVLAFQKVEGLRWTGAVDAALWHRLERARPPRAHYPGSHLEISKGRQVLLVVRGGRVRSAIHVSTGATGNTPLGRWQVYRKVPGWDWVLWYPMYFLRGFAIHGYPNVPAYPASHGCIRVPMWIAPSLYATNSYGETIYIYW